MTHCQILLSIFEAVAVAFVIWAVFNEDKFVKLEERIAERWRRL